MPKETDNRDGGPAAALDLRRLAIGTQVLVNRIEEGQADGDGDDETTNTKFVDIAPGSVGRVVWGTDNGLKTEYWVSFKEVWTDRGQGVSLFLTSDELSDPSRFGLLPVPQGETPPPWPAHVVGTKVKSRLGASEYDDVDKRMRVTGEFADGFIHSVSHGESDEDKSFPYTLRFPAGVSLLADDAMLSDSSRYHIDGVLSGEEMDAAREEWVRNRIATRFPAFPAGTQILSVEGEESWVDGEGEIHTGPEAVGTITHVYPEQEDCYSVSFDNGVWVFMSDIELADTKRYKVLGRLSDEDLQALLAKMESEGGETQEAGEESEDAAPSFSVN